MSVIGIRDENSSVSKRLLLRVECFGPEVIHEGLTLVRSIERDFCCGYSNACVCSFKKPPKTPEPSNPRYLRTPLSEPKNPKP